MKILIVCDQFPPAFGPRMGYLCKYLSRLGCETDVVSEYIEDRRFDFLASFPSKKLMVSYYRHSPLPGKGEWVRLMLSDLLWHSKDRKMLKEVKRHPEFSGYNIVLCSTFRTFPLRSGLRLARRFGVPLIVDLRDIVEQFPDNSYIAHRLPIGDFLNRLLISMFTRRLLRERNRVLSHAAAVTTVSPWHRDFLSKFHPEVELIYNGYDPELFFPEPTSPDVFRITFTGRLISEENRNPQWLFEAVRDLDRSKAVSSRDFRLCWYVDPRTAEYLEKAGAEYGIGEYMEISDFVPASRIPAILNESSVLLQLAAVSGPKGPKGVMTTKIFEALAVGRPLLLIPDDRSFLSELIRNHQSGLAAQNAEQVKDFLMENYRIWKKEGSVRLHYDPGIEALFSREKQAGQFLSLFERVCRRS